jgi:hypothetical protein
MFLDKPEDIAYFNRIMRDSPHLEPYFAELAVWAWIYQKDKYLDIIREYEEQVNDGTMDTVNKALENMEL